MYTLMLGSLTVDDFLALRRSVAWRTPDEEVAKNALENSLICAYALADDKIVGMARIVGDGAMYYYIQDVVVNPDYQHRGIGTALVDKLKQWVNETAPKNAYLSLTTKPGLAGFYRTLGFSTTDDVLMIAE